MSKLPTVCIVGAGSSGIAAAKALHERSIPVEVYEKSDRVGGNWVFRNRNGMSSSYKTLHINTSRERMEYSDFPMPKRYPDFPHHTHIAEYFNATSTTSASVRPSASRTACSSPSATPTARGR